jgi:hypothetical protein
LVGHQRVNNVLPCGWSQDGLHTFNALAKEISKDRNDHGDEFKMAFKTSIEQEMQNNATNKNGKRKRYCIDTYNDLNESLLFVKHGEEDSDDDSKDEWVTKNEFQV